MYYRYSVTVPQQHMIKFSCQSLQSTIDVSREQNYLKDLWGFIHSLLKCTIYWICAFRLTSIFNSMRQLCSTGPNINETFFWISLKFQTKFSLLKLKNFWNNHLYVLQVLLECIGYTKLLTSKWNNFIHSENQLPRSTTWISYSTSQYYTLCYIENTYTYIV